jgi:hypothetical protein
MANMILSCRPGLSCISHMFRWRLGMYCQTPSVMQLSINLIIAMILINFPPHPSVITLSCSIRFGCHAFFPTPIGQEVVIWDFTAMLLSMAINHDDFMLDFPVMHFSTTTNHDAMILELIAMHFLHTLNLFYPRPWHNIHWTALHLSPKPIMPSCHCHVVMHILYVLVTVMTNCNIYLFLCIPHALALLDRVCMHDVMQFINIYRY